MYKSIVEYFADKSGSQCGYCRNRKSSYSHGMWGHVLTCQDYQDLIDRGWRRSGRYCYKPTMDKTCCPQYTIKCDATQFQLTKSQKKLLKKFRNFVIKGDDPPKTSLPTSATTEMSSSEEEDFSEDEKDDMDVEATTQAKAMDIENKLKLDPKDLKISEGTQKEPSSSSSEEAMEQSSKKADAKAGKGADPSKPKSKKKKELRKEKALAKLLASGKTEADFKAKQAAKNQAKSIEDFTSLDDFPPDSRHKFEIRLVKAQTSDAIFNESYLDSYNVYKKYQMFVHKDPPSKCTISQYKRFLCNASLSPSNVVEEKDGLLGAFHQQYIIDGRIFAVGVIDILPHCVSSVYLYYDPDFSFLSPGTLTSLFEIAFTRKLHRERSPDLNYYYMGFYIHSCSKMRYKAKYSPSWLLCPKSYKWVPVKNCLPLLDKSKYAVLSPEESSSASAASSSIELDESLILFENQAMTFGLYQHLSKAATSEVQEVEEYASLIGDSLSKKILLYRG